MKHCIYLGVILIISFFSIINLVERMKRGEEESNLLTDGENGEYFRNYFFII